MAAPAAPPPREVRSIRSELVGPHASPVALRRFLTSLVRSVAQRILQPSDAFDPEALTIDDDGVAIKRVNRTAWLEAARYVSPHSLSLSVDPNQLCWGVGVFLCERLTGRHAWAPLPADAVTPTEVDLTAAIRSERPYLSDVAPRVWPNENPIDDWRRWHQLARSLVDSDSNRRWVASDIVAWLDGAVAPDSTVGGQHYWDLTSWVNAVVAHPAEAVGESQASFQQWTNLFDSALRPAAAHIHAVGGTTPAKLSAMLSAMLLLAGSSFIVVENLADRPVSSGPAFRNGRMQRSLLGLLSSDVLDPLWGVIDPTRALQLASARDAIRCIQRITPEMTDELWSIISMPPQDRADLARRERMRLVRAAEGSRLAALLSLKAPTIDDDTELLARILLSGPADGLVTGEEALAVDRLEALRASGVPHDASRVIAWIRLDEPLPEQACEAAAALRRRFVSSPYSALARAHRKARPTVDDMLLIIAANDDACIWVERFAAAAPNPERAAVRRREEWSREMARLDAELADAEAEWKRLMTSGLG